MLINVALFFSSFSYGNTGVSNCTNLKNIEIHVFRIWTYRKTQKSCFFCDVVVDESNNGAKNRTGDDRVNINP